MELVNVINGHLGVKSKINEVAGLPFKFTIYDEYRNDAKQDEKPKLVKTGDRFAMLEFSTEPPIQKRDDDDDTAPKWNNTRYCHHIHSLEKVIAVNCKHCNIIMMFATEDDIKPIFFDNRTLVYLDLYCSLRENMMHKTIKGIQSNIMDLSFTIYVKDGKIENIQVQPQSSDYWYNFFGHRSIFDKVRSFPKLMFRALTREIEMYLEKPVYINNILSCHSYINGEEVRFEVTPDRKSIIIDRKLIPRNISTLAVNVEFGSINFNNRVQLYYIELPHDVRKLTDNRFYNADIDSYVIDLQTLISAFKYSKTASMFANLSGSPDLKMHYPYTSYISIEHGIFAIEENVNAIYRYYKNVEDIVNVAWFRLGYEEFNNEWNTFIDRHIQDKIDTGMLF